MIPSSTAEYLANEIRGLSPEDAVARLAELGVVSPLRCEQTAIRHEVEHLTHLGHGRCEAMEATAARFHCSYAKVRQAIYYKPKN